MSVVYFVEEKGGLYSAGFLRVDVVGYAHREVLQLVRRAMRGAGVCLCVGSALK